MKNSKFQYFSKTLFIEIFKQVMAKIGICFLAFFMLTMLVDFMNNYASAIKSGYTFTKFLYFEIVFIMDLLSESMAFIVCIAFIWFFVSFSFSGVNKISLTFGINPYKIVMPAMCSVVILMMVYLFVLKSLFINMSNEAQYLMMQFKSRNKQVVGVANNITIVKKNDDTKDIIILYLNNPYYKKFKDFTGKREFNYEIYPQKVSILTYNQNIGVKNWQTFFVNKIVQSKEVPENIEIELTTAELSDILILQKSGIDIIKKNDIYRIMFECNVNLLINQIDVEGKNIFVFSFVSLPLKIAGLKMQGLSYNIFENQFYSIIKTALLLIAAMLVPMYFLFNINARSFIVLRLILSAILVFLFTFVFCYFLSTQASLIKRSLLIFALNTMPPIFLINLFLFLILRKHC